MHESVIDLTTVLSIAPICLWANAILTLVSHGPAWQSKNHSLSLTGALAISLTQVDPNFPHTSSL